MRVVRRWRVPRYQILSLSLDGCPPRSEGVSAEEAGGEGGGKSGNACRWLRTGHFTEWL